ncbi:hypothetical protein VaNZ11_003295, partial [Volvox africanus]
MDQEDEYGGLFLVSVDGVGRPGLWDTTKGLLESRSTLHNLVLHNKLGRAVTVERLALQFVPSWDKRLHRLRPFAHSAVVWFRLPFAHLLLVSTVDSSEYRNVLRSELRRKIAGLEQDWGGPPAPGPSQPQPSGMGALLGGSSAAATPPAGLLGAEWIIVYVRPPDADAGDKAARKVYDRIKDDFSQRGRTRVIRIDPPAAVGGGGCGGGGGSGAMSWGASRGGSAGIGGGFFPSTVLGLEDLELCLRECVRSSFESRQAAYMAEVQRLANERRDPNWSFASLYLVKDSLALLLEGCGLHLEAYKEYVELEAAYQETLERQQQGQQQGAVDLGEQRSGAEHLNDDKFGASGDGAEVATLTSASWRVTRRSVLKRAAVQEFRFRQYLFASQSRLLLRLGRPVDVAERGLRFIGALEAELGQRERSPTGGVRPLFQEAWTVSACLAVVAAVTASVFGRDPSLTPPLLGGAGGGGGFGAAGGVGHSHTNSWDVAGFWGSGGEAPGGTAPTAARGPTRPATATDAANSKSVAAQPESQQPEGVAGASPPPQDADPSATGGADPPTSRTEAVAAAAAAAAAAGHVDWQLWVPFHAEVPSLDPTAICGQVIAPATLAASCPTNAEALLRQVTFQGFMLALAHLYSSALSALLRLAVRAAQMVHVPPPVDAGDVPDDVTGMDATCSADLPGSPTANDWTKLLAAWRQGLQELAPQYGCRTVVGMFVDQEEDRQFEATPQQQATQLQLLRQAISGQAAEAGVATGPASFTTVSGFTAAASASPLQSQGNVTTPRGDGSPAASPAVWLTPTAGSAPLLPELPQPGFRHHVRSDSMYSVSIAAGSTAAGATAGVLGGTTDLWDATLQAAGVATEAAPAGTAAASVSRSALSTGFSRTQMPWATDPELLSTTAAHLVDVRVSGPQRKSNHQHSSSADGANGSFFTKLDIFANKVSSALDPLRPQRPTVHQASGLPSPRVVADQVGPCVSTATPTLHATRDAVRPPPEAVQGPGEDLAQAGPSGNLVPSPLPAALLLPGEVSWLRDWRVRLALSSP